MSKNQVEQVAYLIGVQSICWFILGIVLACVAIFHAPIVPGIYTFSCIYFGLMLMCLYGILFVIQSYEESSGVQ